MGRRAFAESGFGKRFTPIELPMTTAIPAILSAMPLSAQGHRDDRKMTENGVNHSEDFGHRLRASSLGHLFLNNEARRETC